MKFSNLATTLICSSLLQMASAWTTLKPLSTKSLAKLSFHNGLYMSNSDDDDTKVGRRAFFQQSAILTGATAASILTTNSEAALAASDGQQPGKIYTPAANSLSDQVILITGATTGLGLESAKRLATAGATLILTGRTESKGEKAVAAVQEYLKEKGIENNKVYSVPLDLDDLDNVRNFPKVLTSKMGSDIKINTLMNNAGVMAIPERELTKDGYERTFQSNHLGHFLLTNKLMPFMVDQDAKVINVSSLAYQFAGKGLELDNLNGEREYGPWSSYGQSKLANILFSKELQMKAQEAGKSITAVSLHPGGVQTDLARNLVGPEKWEKIKTDGLSFTEKIVFGALSKLTLTVEEGATTQVWLAAGQGGDASKIGGDFFDKCKPVKLPAFATDMEKAKQLWEVSEKLTGEEFKL